MAGAIVYWRASDRHRSRQLAEEIDEGIAEGRDAAGMLRNGSDDDSRPFDQR